MTALLLPELPVRSPAVLRRSLDAVIEATLSARAEPAGTPRQLTGRLPTRAELTRGAEALGAAPDSPAAQLHLALLEAALIVAAADGLVEAERSALQSLLEHLVNQPDLSGLLNSLEAGLKAQGASERLDVLARTCDTFALREQALSFAALAAIADRELSEPEADRLLDLGARFGFGVGEVQRVIDRMALALTEALEQS